jgi:hypothetical protein
MLQINGVLVVLTAINDVSSKAMWIAASPYDLKYFPRTPPRISYSARISCFSSLS